MDHIEESKLLEMVKDNLKSEGVNHNFSEIKLTRFLRGRKHDVEKTTKALIKHLEWLNTNNIEAISEVEIKTELDIGKLEVLICMIKLDLIFNYNNYIVFRCLEKTKQESQ